MLEVKDAIKWFEDNMNDGYCSQGESCVQCNAELTALSVLKEKESRSIPLPLTIDEMIHRIGKPVWCQFEIGESFGKISKSQWFILAKSSSVSEYIFATSVDGVIYVNICIDNSICKFYDNQPRGVL